MSSKALSMSLSIFLCSRVRCFLFPFPLFLVIFPLEEEDVVGDVRGETGFLVLNPLWYGIRTGRGGGEGDSCLMGVLGRP